MSSDSESDGTPSALMFDLSLHDNMEQRSNTLDGSTLEDPQPSTSRDYPQPSTSRDYPATDNKSLETGATNAQSQERSRVHSHGSIYISPTIHNASSASLRNPGKLCCLVSYFS